jgi:hypothetical protein
MLLETYVVGVRDYGLGRAMRKHTKTESSSDNAPHPEKEPVLWKCKLNLPDRLSGDIKKK